MRALAAVLIALLLAGTASAQRENDQPIESRGLADLNRGLLIDGTVTVLGHEFFNAFAAAWREIDSRQRYSLSVFEYPTARFGSRIVLQYRQQVIFNSLLRPNRQAARELAPVLAGDIFQSLIAREAEEALFRDADLGKEELQ